MGLEVGDIIAQSATFQPTFDVLDDIVYHICRQCQPILHWDNEMVDICIRLSQIHFIGWKFSLSLFSLKFFLTSNQRQVVDDSGNGLAPNRRQAIAWSNVDEDIWQMTLLCNTFCFQHSLIFYHDDVIKWKHFPCYWPFVRGIHRSPVNYPHKGRWRGALMFSLICVWINGWVNNREAGNLRRYRAHYDVIVMCKPKGWTIMP